LIGFPSQQNFNDSRLLQPSKSLSPDADTILEETGTINDLNSHDTSVEEKCLSSLPKDTSLSPLPIDDNASPFNVDDSASSSHSQYLPHPPKQILLTSLSWLGNGMRSSIMTWNLSRPMLLMLQLLVMPQGGDASLFEPAPSLAFIKYLTPLILMFAISYMLLIWNLFLFSSLKPSPWNSSNQRKIYSYFGSQ
jgi:hypothetical protein